MTRGSFEVGAATGRGSARGGLTSQVCCCTGDAAGCRPFPAASAPAPEKKYQWCAQHNQEITTHDE